ncbi:PREDICTED: AN1-type zinc finger protein 2A isoform X1 [Myotis brandtii]|uniref:AN1-type zinc finger protein 2A isoform X1 n=1 Tax=Myotis brandtii TaxID=109478 RepID=UPI0003BBAD83|nr:PREDICTED: AN1-type zinc finger protein 2A isoform X1 [Myotis brandtii]XP_014390748.1 PREDICTED: AN1-type zinc finger protein 2A isoform X1 [Myotis brandtii]
MEFPDLGKHCSEKTCKQLDFLPLKCDVCEQDFCKDHFTYAAHKCPFAYKKDVQVPVCPLCNHPISVKKGEIPDVVVGEHMDRDCGSRPGKEEKVESEVMTPGPAPAAEACFCVPPPLWGTWVLGHFHTPHGKGLKRNFPNEYISPFREISNPRALLP